MGVKLKQVLLFPFTKFRRKKRTKTRANLPSSSSSSSSSTGKTVVSGDGFCGGFCCARPRTLESADDSKPSDPNDPTFTYDMLRTLIEKNHFHSGDCNPHSA
ncbi:hypothetical protein HRI_002092400 [Hibiscus trionum]|uniref:Uncharacterized protein n=1 Tax=Hibiscus trionum TaxID=183268 RepID=A0A9W7M1J7_HIBTR|nr:hypothetical protein HRI_002092400 [Hibiscus trionum]